MLTDLSTMIKIQEYAHSGSAQWLSAHGGVSSGWVCSVCSSLTMESAHASRWLDWRVICSRWLDLTEARQIEAWREDSVHGGTMADCCKSIRSPFPIVKRVGIVAYKLGLPSRLKFQLGFHVSCLKLYHANVKDPDRCEPKQVAFGATTAYDKDIKTLTDKRVVRILNYYSSCECLVKWKDLVDCETSWEPKHALLAI
ncbi:hypothetical protein Patl1_18871 [Pistacia atlantica]|uniref:Uncharacterized protein n=1 Tax=Pistacia atlantica TaxID=434234 RepID=A0ACC1BXU2_9ROSI|nr:hypothetical protein Patl1_18871 [Pistacia atlantica]